MGAVTAEIQVLTAEVRVLMVGSRQVTLSVFRQLDWVSSDDILPFGRVKDDKTLKDDANEYGGPPDDLQVVGVGSDSSDCPGVLVRSSLKWHTTQQIEKVPTLKNDEHRAWSELPLIVLAGLR